MATETIRTLPWYAPPRVAQAMGQVRRYPLVPLAMLTFLLEPGDVSLCFFEMCLERHTQIVAGRCLTELRNGFGEPLLGVVEITHLRQEQLVE